jgi:predicted CXXCH cytochrome family protein
MLLRGPGVSNHPVGMAPSSSVNLPADWPLDPDGTMTCLTCHSNLPSSRGSGDPCLRDFDPELEAATEFCMKCHGGSSHQGRADVHWMAVQTAHVGAEATPTAPSSHLLDAQTRQCLGCHDGVGASESSNTTPWNRGHAASFGGPQGNHPVGVSYPTGSQARTGSQFRAKSFLPEQVQLPRGQVSCVSCHDLYSGDRYLLTVPIEGSELCFTCHDMK